MSERLREAYLKKEENRILDRVAALPSQRKFRARMAAAGRKFKDLRAKEDRLGLPPFSLSPKKGD